MAQTPEFDIRDGYAYFQPAGRVTPDSFVDLLRQAMAACRERHIYRLLINSTGFKSRPGSVMEQYTFAESVSKFWDRSIRLAFIDQAGKAAAYDFEETVARNRGIDLRVHSNEQEALTWLLRGN